MVLLPLLACFLAQTDAAELMTRVAANLERGSELRRRYVYSQKLHTRLLRTNSKLAREEKREYVITPNEKNTDRKLVRFEGRYEKHGKVLGYDDPEFRHKDVDIDGELIEDFAEDMVEDKDSRDGIDMNLFPFQTKDLELYEFKFIGDEVFRGRPVRRVSFTGKTKEKPWSGEALIDTEDLHPISIQTKLNFKMPLIVRTMFGTNLRQTGFSLTYVRLEPGVWFPASYGTEMRLDVLFGYKRVIAMSMETSDFRKLSAESTVKFDPETR